MQMSCSPLTGSLAFTTQDGIAYSTGQIGGQVALTGCLSESLVTLGLGLVLPAGSKQWLTDVTTGNVGVFLAGAPHDALYMPGTLFATATLSLDLLEETAANLGLALSGKDLGESGVVDRPLPDNALRQLQAEFGNLHFSGLSSDDPSFAMAGRNLLQAFIYHLGREPRPYIGKPIHRGYARIVAKARAFIIGNLDRPLSIDAIAAAASTSQRTLHRAFLDVLNETPYSYVKKVRLHRIRHELISDAEKACTIKIAVHRWGITELGRFAGWYNELFGERPSETVSFRRGNTRASSM
jgi:AraC-like DNA-binding protein